MKRNDCANNDLTRPAKAELVTFRERIGSLSELVNDLRRRAEDVSSTLEVLGLFGLQSSLSMDSSELDFYDEVRRFEIFLIKNALRRTKGSQVKAARLLNLNETTLNSKIKNLNIDLGAYFIIDRRSG